MTKPKIHAFIAHSGLTSRRKAEELVAQGKVTVNNKPAMVGMRVDPSRDTVQVNGTKIDSAPEKFRYILINKPRGIVSTTADELGRKNVTELVPQVSERLYPVGRLDMESEGLMLLTNDGQLTQQLTHPSFEIAKTYHVRTPRQLSQAAQLHMLQGVKLTDGYAQPDEFTELSSSDQAHWYEITLSEGRNQQVRRMFRRLGYEVEQLIRIKLGPWDISELDGKPYKMLDPQDIVALKSNQLALTTPTT